MERLTRRDDDSCARYGLGPNQNVIDRLALIEDILGDDYDLDRLREIVQKNIKYEQTGLEPEEIERLKGEAFGLKVDKQELEQYRAIGPIDRLRELVEADNMVGKLLWFTKWFTPEMKIGYRPISRMVISFSRLKGGEIILHLKDGALPMRLVGDCAYKTREDAEAALKGERNAAEV